MESHNKRESLLFTQSISSVLKPECRSLVITAPSKLKLKYSVSISSKKREPLRLLRNDPGPGPSWSLNTSPHLFQCLTYISLISVFLETHLYETSSQKTYFYTQISLVSVTLNYINTTSETRIDSLGINTIDSWKTVTQLVHATDERLTV